MYPGIFTRGTYTKPSGSSPYSVGVARFQWLKRVGPGYVAGDPLVLVLTLISLTQLPCTEKRNRFETGIKAIQYIPRYISPCCIKWEDR